MERDIKFLGEKVFKLIVGQRVKSGNGSTPDMRSPRVTINWITPILGFAHSLEAKSTFLLADIFICLYEAYEQLCIFWVDFFGNGFFLAA